MSTEKDERNAGNFIQGSLTLNYLGYGGSNFIENLGTLVFLYFLYFVMIGIYYILAFVQKKKTDILLLNMTVGWLRKAIFWNFPCFLVLLSS